MWQDVYSPISILHLGCGIFRLNDASSHTIPSSTCLSPLGPREPQPCTHAAQCMPATLTSALDGITHQSFSAIPHERWESEVWCPFLGRISLRVFVSYSECLSTLNPFSEIWMQKKHSNSFDVWFWSTIWLPIKIYLLPVILSGEFNSLCK